MNLRLKEVRQSKNMTQRQLCDKSGVHWATISDIERGARDNIELTTLFKLATALGVGVGDLVD